MFLRISLVISLVNICSCATPTYPEGNSNQAVYSQSFHRDDVPVSYKYSTVHVYTRPPKNEEPSKTMNNGIQYAPLTFQYDEQQQQSYAKDYLESTTEKHTESAGNTKLLEPKLVSNNPTYNPGLNKYIPGQNVRVLQSSVRTPAHTFRIIPDTERNIKERDMTDYMKEFLLYQEPQTLPTAVPMTSKPNLHMFERPKPTLYTSIYKPQTNPQVNLYMPKNLNFPRTLTYQGHGGQMFSAKVPQVHLNIGQEQKYPSQHQRTQKTHLDQARFYAYPVKGPERFVNPQKKNAPSDTKQLQPLPNHLHLSAYSRT